MKWLEEMHFMRRYGVVDIYVDDETTNTTEYSKYDDLFLKITNQYQKSLVSTATRVDSKQWQIVLKQMGEVYSICREILDKLEELGQKGYIGIGVGDISTKEASDSRTMDGEAFILARESLELAISNRTNYSKVIPTSNCRIYFKSNQEDSGSKTSISKDQLINSFIQNNEVLISKITKKQKDSIELYEQYGSYNDLIQNNPNVKKGTLSDKMSKSNYWMIQKNNKVIEQLLKSYQNS